jgi:glycosyltransferase involved in cell wall biosynthesis
MALPRISIVTPSYNQGKFIEETIRSVLDQGYPNLEYIIIDGGSTDDSVDIIRRFEKQLTHWVSEKDNGAADAIAKGFAKATGEVFAYLNSDDVYLPGTLQTIGSLMADPRIDVAFGNMYWVDTQGKKIGERRQTRFLPMGYVFGGSDLMQPATFWRKDIYLKNGGIDPSYRFTFDADLFFRFALRGARFKFVNKFLASFRIHPQSKSSTEDTICLAEMQRMREKYLPFPHKSFRGRCVRAMTWLYRTIWYTLQGDLFWLAARIPDRLRAPWAPGIVGPKGRRV